MWGEEIIAVGDCQRLGVRITGKDVFEYGIIRSEKEKAAGAYQQNAAISTNGRIHDDDMNGFRREKAMRLIQGKSRSIDISLSDAMCNIHNLRRGVDAQNDAFHYTDKRVAKAKVGRQRNDTGFALHTLHSSPLS